jgi:hypothetical protein
VNSRESKRAEKISRDYIDPLIIKNRFNKMKRYVFKFVNSLIVIYASGFLSQTINYVLATSKMPLRNPTTNHSSRAPKMKEYEIVEGYSPGTMRKLEYAPMAEPVTKKKPRNIMSSLWPLVIQSQALDTK